MKRIAIAVAGAALLCAGPSLAQSQSSGHAAANPDDGMPEICRNLSQSAPRGAGMQNMPMMQGGMQNMPMGQHMSEAGRDYMQVMQGMNPPMMASIMIEDPDVAFLCTMIPHHQGAIGMARAVLKHGKDAEVKKLAEKTIKEQEEDIKELTEAVKMQAK